MKIHNGNKRSLVILLLLIIGIQIAAISYFKLNRFLIPRVSVREIVGLFKDCEGYPRFSDLCRDFSMNSGISGIEFTSDEKFVYQTHRVNDGSTIKYDAKTGKKVEICGFWIGFATQRTPPCASPEELEKINKNR